MIADVSTTIRSASRIQIGHRDGSDRGDLWVQAVLVQAVHAKIVP